MKTRTAMKLAALEAGARASCAVLARLWSPPLSRQAVRLWGESLPELREFQLRDMRPTWFKKTR